MSIALLASLTCFRESFEKQGLRWVLEQTANLGLDGLEPWNVRGEMERPKETAELLRDMGISTPSYCCVGAHFASSDPKVRRAAHDVIRKNLDICRLIGAKFMRIDFGRTDIATYTEAKGRLVEAITPSVEDARQAGVVLAIHNHGVAWTGESEPIKNVIEMVASRYLRSRTCPGNFLLAESETDPVGAAIRLIPLAGGMFLKDWRTEPLAAEKGLPAYRARGETFVGCSVGKGVIDYHRFLDALKATHYSGFFVLNIQKGAESDLQAIRESVEFVRRSFP